MTSPAPLALHEETVRAEWIDYNGHMNVAYYVLAFDHATDRLFEHLGLGQNYLRECHCSVFVVESHVLYEHEVSEGEPLRFETYVLGNDTKRLHFFHTMYHRTEGHLVATNELLALHVSMDTRRALPFPEEQLTRVSSLVEGHAQLPTPPQVGRVIGLRNRRPGRPTD
jgi:acyl-CoA thioester hydrolase